MRPILKNLMVGTVPALLAAGCAATGNTGSSSPPPAYTATTTTATTTPTATTASPTAEVTVYGCDRKPVSQPKTYTLACGDGGIVLEKLTWTGWGATTATATGVQIQNSCVPSCAAGSPVSADATATLSDLSGGHYTKLHVVTAKKTTDYTIDASGPLAAH